MILSGNGLLQAGLATAPSTCTSSDDEQRRAGAGGASVSAQPTDRPNGQLLLEGRIRMQVFAASPNAGVDGEPLQALVAFDKVHVPAGATVVTSLDLKAHHLAPAAITGERAVAKGTWKVWVGYDGRERAVDLTIV